MGNELRIRAPRQRVTAIEARNGIVRVTVHIMEEDFKKRDISIDSKRSLAEALFVSNAFTFYNGVSPYNALQGRQPACLPDLNAPDHESSNDSSDHSREQQIRHVSLGAITQSTVVAKANRALEATTRQAGPLHYKPGGLVSYDRPTST